MKADQNLDCRGLLCPLPVVKTAEKIKGLKEGETLEITGTDRGMIFDMPAWCQATGNEFLGKEETNGEIRVYIKKTK